MRNLAEYPVTIEEIIAVLEDIHTKIAAEERIGDMRPLLISQAIKRVRSSTDLHVDDLGMIKDGPIRDGLELNGTKLITIYSNGRVVAHQG